MSKAEQVAAEDGEFTYKGEEFKVPVLKGDDFISTIVRVKKKNLDEEEIMQELIYRTLKKLDSDVDRGFVRDMDMGLYINYMKNVQDVNGLQDFLGSSKKEMVDQLQKQ